MRARSISTKGSGLPTISSILRWDKPGFCKNGYSDDVSNIVALAGKAPVHEEDFDGLCTARNAEFSGLLKWLNELAQKTTRLPANALWPGVAPVALDAFGRSGGHGFTGVGIPCGTVLHDGQQHR